MAAGERRLGNPRTDEERKERHLALYGDENIPEVRGAGLEAPGDAGETGSLTWILLALAAYFFFIKK